MEARRSDGSPSSRRGSGSFQPSFEAVLQASRDGHGRAFEQIFAALNRRLHAFARVRRAADPEGTVNEVFLQVFVRLGDFEGNEQQFLAWVFRIARNKLIDEARQMQRRPVEIVPDDLDEAGPPDAVDAAVAERIATDELVDRLAVLTTEQRDVVLLRVVSDLTIDQIADVIGKRPGAVKALQRRAFRTLAKSFSAEAVPL